MESKTPQHNSSYGRFAAMVAVSTIVMFDLMYLNTYEADHIFSSQTRAWMALVMGATMATPWHAAPWLLFTIVHSGMLGALLTMAPAPLYPLYVARATTLGPLAEQQLAGLIMWVPMGTAYLLATLAIVARGLRPEVSRDSVPGALGAPLR